MSEVLDAQPVEGYKGGQTSPHSPTEAPDSLHSTAYARVLDLICEGPIRGFKHGSTNPLQDVYLNETPVANPDGTLNFSNIQVDSRSGTQAQAYMPGFADAVENEFSNPVELRSGTPWTQALTNLDLTAVRVRLSVPSLQKTDTNTGDITAAYIAYTIELSTDGGAYQQVISSGFGGKTTTKYEKTHRIVLPTATTGWTVRVTRTTANANQAYISDTTTVEGYTEIIDAKLRYPNSALIGILFDAQQFSSIPSRAYDLYGRIVKVPSNYDPDARTYTGTWDGSFKLAWTNNPAWIFYDVATNARFSVGRYVSEALMNKWALYDIGQYCDELVPDGNGGQEPRFTATIYLQTQGDAYRVLGDLASIFRGQMYWAAGAIQASADMPGDPVYPYNQSNVIGGKFTYTGSRRKTRFTVALVSWNDPDDFGRAKVVTVVDPDGLRRYGYQPTSLIAVGCSSRGQAQRAGYWTLYTSRLDTETCSWRVGMDGTVAAPGQIVTVSDPARAGKRMGGRVTRATPSTTTDVFVDAAPGQVAIGDTLYITTSAAVTEARTISAINGTQLTVGTAFSEAPAPDTVWQVEATTLQTAKYRILGVREPSSNSKAMEWEIVGLLHNASKFAAVDIGADIETPPITSIPPAAQPAPTTVVLSSFQVKGAVSTTIAVNVQWTPTAAAVYYLVEWRRDSGNWMPLPPQRTLSADIDNPKPGTYEARVYAINASGKRSLPTYADALTLSDPTDLPTTVEQIQTQANNAATDSNNALQQLAYIASDNRLTQGEKPIAIKDYSVITSEQAGIDAEANRYSITTEKTDYDNAVTALTNLLNTYTTPTAWNDLGGDTDIVGSTWRSTWGAVYTKRQTLLNKVLASAKANGDYAINQGKSAPVVNPAFANGLDGWTFDTNNVGEWYTEAGANPPAVTSTTYLVHKGVAGQTTTCAHNTGGGIPVKPNQGVTATIALRVVGANAGAHAYVRVGWCDANGNLITNSTQGVSICTVDAGSNYFTLGVSRVFGYAPANAVRAIVEIEFDNHTSGYFAASVAAIALQPSSLNEVPDGGGRYGVHQVDGNGLAIVDLSQSGHVNKTLDYIGDGGTWGRVRKGQLSGGLIFPQRAGSNLIDNPSFEQNLSGSPYNTSFYSGGIIDGWVVGDSSAGHCNIESNVGVAARSGINKLTCFVDPNVTIAAGAYKNVVAQSAAKIPVRPGEYYYVEGYMGIYSNAALNGLSTRCSLGLIYYTASDAYAGETTVSCNNNAGAPGMTGAPLSSSGQVPSNAAYARFWCFASVSNSTGAAITTPSSGTICLPYFDDLFACRLTALGAEVNGTLASQRRLPLVTWGNYGGGWSGLTVNYSTTTTSCTFSASAANYVGGGDSIAYNSSSCTVSGSAGATVTYYLFYDDPSMTGGSKTLQATTDAITSLNAAGRVLVIKVSVTYPTSGTGSGGGTGWCPSRNAWVYAKRSLGGKPEFVRAGEVEVGDYLLLTSGRWGRVSYSKPELSPCVRVLATNGKTLTCSESAPLELSREKGTFVRADRALHHSLRAYYTPDNAGRETVVDVTNEGVQWVQHITCEHDSFLCGDDPSCLFGHHNMKPVN